MKNAVLFPHRLAAFLALLAIVSTIPLSGFLVFRTINDRNTQAQASSSDVPLIDKQDAVVIAERKVCSLMGDGMTSVGVTGLDGGASTKAGSTNYFTFGDTNVSGVGQIPNSIATGSDTEAGDCISLTSKSAGGKASATITKLSNECTVWPTDLVEAPDGRVHIFFVSLVWSGPICEIQHVGLAELNKSTLNSTRVVPVFFNTNDVQIPNYRILTASVTRVGNEVYVYWGGQRKTDNMDAVLLSKVPVADIANKASYTYWDGNSFVSNPGSMVPLWDQGPIGTNGMTIRYNQYLGKWTAIYNTAYVSVMAMRTADNVTGPWSTEQVIINCLQYYKLGSSGNHYPCYGAKEYKEFQKNNGQTIYTVQSHTLNYQPFLHETVFGKAIEQHLDDSENSAYLKTGENIEGFSSSGTAFYVSDFPVSGFSPIREWIKGSERLYSATSPGGDFADNGIKFYAPTTKKYLHAPIYKWSSGQKHRYSALDLTAYGYTKASSPAFYAVITNYRIKNDKVFERQGSSFHVGLKKNGQWVQGASIKSVKFSGLNGGSKYSPVINTPLRTDRYMGQNVEAGGDGNLEVFGDFAYVNFANIGIFQHDQQLNATTNLYGYWVTRLGGQPAVEIGTQVNPYARAGTFKNFFITSEASNNVFNFAVCGTECGVGPVVFTGQVNNCGEDLTVTPTGPTQCAKLGDLMVGGLAANTKYDLYVCNPSCEFSVVKMVYERMSDANGDVRLDPNSVRLPANKFLVEYFNNADFSDLVLAREEDRARLISNGRAGSVPAPQLQNDGQFSVRWQGFFDFSSAKYRFNISSAYDYGKLYVDDQIKAEGSAVANALVQLEGEHKIKYEYIKTTVDRPYFFSSNFFDRNQCYDLDSNSVIGASDLSVASSHFGERGETPWDIDGNGAVNSADFGLIASKHGQECPFQ